MKIAVKTAIHNHLLSLIFVLNEGEENLEKSRTRLSHSDNHLGGVAV